MIFLQLPIYEYKKTELLGTILDDVNHLIEKGVGDKARLEHIKQTIENGKTLYDSDRSYVEDLALKQNPLENKEENISTSESIKDEKQEAESNIQDELKEAQEKIERLEKQSEIQEERDYRQTFYKSEGTTLVLSIVLGLFGINGVGQIYVGRVGRGVGILIGSIVLFIAGIATVYFGVGVVLLIIYFVIFIWQIIDARKLCREYNQHIRETGKRPW